MKECKFNPEWGDTVEGGSAIGSLCGWNFLKHFINSDLETIKTTEDVIHKTFPRFYNAITNITIMSSMERFREFCTNNNLRYYESYEDRTIIIIK